MPEVAIRAADRLIEGRLHYVEVAQIRSGGEFFSEGAVQGRGSKTRQARDLADRETKPRHPSNYGPSLRGWAAGSWTPRVIQRIKLREHINGTRLMKSRPIDETWVQQLPIV